MTGKAALAAAVLGAAVDVGYVLVVRSQGTEIASRVVFFAAFIGVMAALSLAGAAAGGLNERFSQASLYGATAGYLLAGVVGLASIGLPLVLAGLLALVAAGPRRLPVVVVATVAAVLLSAFLLGLALT